MNKKTTKKIKIDLDELKAYEDSKDDHLQGLYEIKLNSSNSFQAIKAKSGTSTSYLCRADNQWAANNLNLFLQMESASAFVKKKEDKDGNFDGYMLEVDQESADEIKQRQPDFARTHQLAIYLLTQPNRQFPPFLAVTEAPWVLYTPDMEEYSEYWDEEDRAKQSVIQPLFNLNSDGSSVLISQNDLKQSFVIDGSHRLIALQSLYNCSKYGDLPKYRKDGKILGSDHVDDIARNNGLTRADLFQQEVMKESFGVQFFSAVEKGETLKEANRRIRSLFVHVNKTANPPSAGENVLLDDDNGFAITARAISVTHPLFSKHKHGDRVDIKKKALPVNSIHLTSIGLLYEVIADYLGHFSEFTHWKAKPKVISIRPQDTPLAEAKKVADVFFDQMLNIPIFKKILGEPDDNFIKQARNFRESGIKATEKNLGHLLLRPIGQRILADAVGQCVTTDGFKIKDIFKKLSKFAKENGFSHFNEYKSIWCGLVYNTTDKKMVMKGKDLAVQLLVYMLRGQTDKEDLLEKYKKARTVGKDEAFYSGDGSKVSSKDDIELPNPIGP